MDEKVAQTSDGVPKKKGAGGVSSVAYGTVLTAIGSGGAPTSSKSSNKSRCTGKVKTQERKGAKDDDEATAAAATLADLTSKFDFKPLMERKERKDIKEMEYEEEQQQQTIITPTMPTGEIALPIPPGETSTVASIDVDDEDLSLSKAIPMDTLLDCPPASVSKKRKRHTKTLSQEAAAEIKEKGFKRARKVVVEPPPSTAPSTPPPYPTGLLEDPSPKKITTEEKDVSLDIAANIASKEKVEKQPVDESKAFKQKEVKYLTKPEDSEQTIEVSKAELDQTKLVPELQEFQSELPEDKEDENQRIRETEVTSAPVLSGIDRERSRSDGSTQAAEVREEEVRLLVETKMKELRAHLEAKFNLEVEANNEQLREVFKQEKEKLQRELKKTEEAHIAVTRINERRVIDEKKALEKTNELQESVRVIQEENKKLIHENRYLLESIGDIKRSKNYDQDLGMALYDRSNTTPIDQNIVSTEVRGTIGTIRNEVMAQNQMVLDDVAKNIEELKKEIELTGKTLTSLQDTRLVAGIGRFGNLINTSINKGEEIEKAMVDLVNQIDVKTVAMQTSVSTAIDMVKRLEGRNAEDMDHDGQTDTDKIRLTWNRMKQNLINMISIANTEIKNLIMAVNKSSAIADKKYVESVNETANEQFSLLNDNENMKKSFNQMGIRVTSLSYGVGEIIPGGQVKVESVDDDLEDDISTTKFKMSIASATFMDINAILSHVRQLAVQFADTERQFLQEIETKKIVAKLEGSIASKLYYELEKFYFTMNTIEDMARFQKVMEDNLPLHEVFKFAIPIMGNKEVNEEIAVFLQRKGYNIKENMISSIDNFFSVIMRKDQMVVSGRGRRETDENVFMSTVTGILATFSQAIQTINNKIEADRKQTVFGEYLENHVSLLAQQIQPAPKFIAAELMDVEDEEKEQGNESFKIIEAQKFEKTQCEQEAIKQALKEKQKTIDILQQQQQTDQMTSLSPTLPPPLLPQSSTPSGGSVVGNGEGANGERRDDDVCFRNVSNTAIANFRENVERFHADLKKTVEELFKETIPDLSMLRREADTYVHNMDKQLTDISAKLPIIVLEKMKNECNYRDTHRDLMTQHSENIRSAITDVGNVLLQYKENLYSRIAVLQDDAMDVTTTDPPREDETDNLKREMKEQLTNVLTRATDEAALNYIGEEAAKVLQTNDGSRDIKMFLKPEEGPDKNFVEVNLSSKDSSHRNINTEGLKKALPGMQSEVLEKTKKASYSRQKKKEVASKNNTLTGKIFMDTLKDKVFPYSSKSALEDESSPEALYHPEYFRSSFSKHFIRDSTSFKEPPTFAEKSESIRNFTRLLEYSLFNDTARGARSDNDMLSRLIYIVFEHDAKMIRYLSDITYKFREYATGSVGINLCKNRGVLLEATIGTVFSAALPVISSMAPRIAEAVSEPVHDDVRIRSTYSLLSLIEKFIFCVSKRVQVLKNVLEKSGLVNKLSLYPADANTDTVTSFDVQYDYSLLRMLLELMAINITNLVDAGIRPLKAVVLSIGTFTSADKTRETDRAFIPIDGDRSVLSKVLDNGIDVPKTISVVNYLSAVTDWYVTNRFSGDNNAGDKESLSEAVDLMYTLLTNNKGTQDLAAEFNKELKEASSPSFIVEYVSKTTLPKLNKLIEEIVEQTKSNDAILVKGASEVGSLGETAVNVSLGVSREHLALPWLEVGFRGGVDDNTLMWVLSGGVNSDKVVRDYQLAVPLCCSYSSIRRKSAAPSHVKPLIRIINNTSGSDNVFLATNNKKKTPGQKEGGGGDRVHVVNLSKNVSCVLEYSTKDRYEAVINKMYRDGLVLVKGDAEVPRVFPTLDGKWMDNSRDNRTFTPLSVSRWKIPSASLVYGMLSKKKTKEEEQNQEDEEKKKKTNISAPSVIDFMGGRAGNVLLEMLTLPPEQLATTHSSSFDVPFTNKGLWKTNKDGYTSIDAQSMMARLISDDKRSIDKARTAAAASSPSSMAMVPYSDAANIVVNDPLEVYNSNNSWWIRGIQPRKRRDAAALSAVQEHLYFVQTPIF